MKTHDAVRRSRFSREHNGPPAVGELVLDDGDRLVGTASFFVLPNGIEFIAVALVVGPGELGDVNCDRVALWLMGLSPREITKRRSKAVHRELPDLRRVTTVDGVQESLQAR